MLYISHTPSSIRDIRIEIDLSNHYRVGIKHAYFEIDNLA